MKRDWARALRRANLRRIRFHDLRHTYASLPNAQGAHPKYIQAQLGHASIQTTLGLVVADIPFEGVGYRFSLFENPHARPTAAFPREIRGRWPRYNASGRVV